MTVTISRKQNLANKKSGILIYENVATERTRAYMYKIVFNYMQVTIFFYLFMALLQIQT